MRPSHQLRIHLFGHLRLTFENQPIASLQTERYQSLLAYFVLRARSPQPRFQLAALFWPNIPDAKAKASLRRELHRIKKMLPESDQFLQVTSKTIAWKPQLPFWLDVTEFETKLDQADQQQESPAAQVQTLQQAIALYQGGLLLTCYDDWIEPTRNRLHKRMLSALSDLGRLLGELQDYPRAIAYTQQLLQLDPLNELGYLKLMQLYVHQGERSNALQVYHQCMTLLRREIGIAPSTEIRQFYESLLLDQGSSPQSYLHPQRIPNHLSPNEESQQMTSGPVPKNGPEMSQIDWGEAPDSRFFYGRTKESAQLRHWIEEDHCRLVAVVGMEGIGKTALAAKVASDLKNNFDFVVWRSLRNAPPLNMLLEDLVSFLSKQHEEEYSIRRLLHWLRQSRCLIILDNMETFFKSGENAGEYRAEHENYDEFLSVVGHANHQSCLLLTSREKPAEIATFAGVNLAVQVLQLRGSPEASLALIDAKQLVGTQVEKEQLCEHYAHNPLFLQMVGSSIRDVFCGEIARFLAEEILLLKCAKRLLDNQFERLTSLEKTVLVWLSINQDWGNLVELKTDIHPSFAKIEVIEALESLCWRSLIDQQGDTYKPQPVILEYVRNYLIGQMSHALANSVGFTEKNCASLAIAAYPAIKGTTDN